MDDVEKKYYISSDEEMEDEVEDELEDENEDIENQNILYSTRLTKLVKDVANSEGFADIRLGKLGRERIQNNVKFLTVILIIEIINSLKESNRKIIKPHHVDVALNRSIINSDSMGFSINKLEQILEELSKHNSQSAIIKATDFINLYLSGENGE